MAVSSWYILYVRGLDDKQQPLPIPSFPVPGQVVCHRLGDSDDDAKMKKDKANPLWDKIQDDARPAWAPDLLRHGFAVLWSRECLIDLLLKLGIKNPEKARKETGGLQHQKGNQRILYFDDVWVVQVKPTHRPLYAPPMKAKPEEWWRLAQTTTPPLISAYLAPGGAKVEVGAQRLADVVASIMGSANGYVRKTPGVDMDPVLEEVAGLIRGPKAFDNEQNKTDSSRSSDQGMQRFNT